MNTVANNSAYRTILNPDLAAHFRPLPTRWNPDHWTDVSGTFADIRVDGPRLRFAGKFSPGLYCARFETKRGAFDPKQAGMLMTKVPEGRKEVIGPWDLNHFEGFMALPSAKVWVNGKLLGAMWFSLPGPQQVKDWQLSAWFGFEAIDEITEVILEWREGDRDRIGWKDIDSLEVRKDARRPVPLRVPEGVHPRVYLLPEDIQAIRACTRKQEWIETMRLKLGEDSTEWGFAQEGGAGGKFDLGCLLFLLTGDEALGQACHRLLMELVRTPTWSAKADPYVIGGDNDRGLGHRLYAVGVGWDWLQPLLSVDDKREILAKVSEYLEKMYDFTVMQIGYMGLATTDPHSLGAWYGVGVAAIAFHDDLEIARKALPLFHGLYLDGLTLFPRGGKTAWATCFPTFLIRYLAAAHRLNPDLPEVRASVYLKNLTSSLLHSFRVPNNQEMQRGKQTVEHRLLTSYLNRFTDFPDSASAFEAFVEEEVTATGSFEPTLFDLLYAPSERPVSAKFPTDPLYIPDIGDVICPFGAAADASFILNAGLRGGARESFSTMPHNREFHPSYGGFAVHVHGSPVLSTPFGYGQFIANQNTLCIGEGAGITEGQVYSGDLHPRFRATITRYYQDERFVVVEAQLAPLLKPELQVKVASRLIVIDRTAGVILVEDTFSGGLPLSFATHLHCLGKITNLSGGRFRLTGGQASAVAGIKFGNLGLSDEEGGSLYFTALGPLEHTRFKEEEPMWFPTYIYGLNGTSDQKFENAAFPRFKRLRWELGEVTTGSRLAYGLSLNPESITSEKYGVRVSDGTKVIFRDPSELLACQGIQSDAILAIEDPSKQRLLLVGASRLLTQKLELRFLEAVEISLIRKEETWEGEIFSATRFDLPDSVHFGAWEAGSDKQGASWVAKMLISSKPV